MDSPTYYNCSHLVVYLLILGQLPRKKFGKCYTKFRAAQQFCFTSYHKKNDANELRHHVKLRQTKDMNLTIPRDTESWLFNSSTVTTSSKFSCNKALFISIAHSIK